MEILEIKQNLRRGDIPRLAKMTRLSAVYCKKILNGSRPTNTENSRNVILAARRLIRLREKMETEMMAEAPSI